MIGGYEKDYDDEVYEDEYYEENFDDEELVDEDDVFDEKDPKDDDKEDDDEYIEDDLSEEDEIAAREVERKIDASYACDDCDYRWDDVIIKRKDVLEDYDDEHDIICPMCGSINISII
jgi:predicted RNA-binding Zn-ribbon protein involved in translation (DUF1610 family)